MKMGRGKIENDKKIDRPQIKAVEEKINNHTRILTKIFNKGEHYGHLKRIQETMITHSETSAPMYHMYKDHKAEPGWRPVVSGCNSNTVGLSTLLSDLVESVCNAIEEPYEVISSEDMLYRVGVFNEKIKKRN